MIRTYSELIQLSTFEERFRYLELSGAIGEETFGFDRYLNQLFYRGGEWKEVRNFVIVRDHGCDLGCLDREILGRIIVHHMNPVGIEDIVMKRDEILNPEFLISSSLITHNGIHYSDESILVPSVFTERKPYDTCPWRI